MIDLDPLLRRQHKEAILDGSKINFNHQSKQSSFASLAPFAVRLKMFFAVKWFETECWLLTTDCYF
jgi:hypothetical protein